MKKIIFFLTAIIFLATVSTSCDDTDNHAEATCTYYVGSDSIVYSNALDAQYDSLILRSIDSLQFTEYIFEETAQVNFNGIASAIALCNSQAEKKFLNKMNSPISLQRLEERLYHDNKTFFNERGIINASDIDLHPITIHVSLWSYTYNGKIKSSTANIY